MPQPEAGRTLVIPLADLHRIALEPPLCQSSPGCRGLWQSGFPGGMDGGEGGDGGEDGHACGGRGRESISLLFSPLIPMGCVNYPLE